MALFQHVLEALGHLGDAVEHHWTEWHRQLNNNQSSHDLAAADYHARRPQRPPMHTVHAYYHSDGTPLSLPPRTRPKALRRMTKSHAILYPIVEGDEEDDDSASTPPTAHPEPLHHHRQDAWGPQEFEQALQAVYQDSGCW